MKYYFLIICAISYIKSVIGVGFLSDLTLECGSVTLPGDPTFDAEYIGSWSFHDNVIPLGIIYCECENDVKIAVEYLTCNDIEFTIRSGLY